MYLSASIDDGRTTVLRPWPDNGYQHRETAIFPDQDKST